MESEDYEIKEDKPDQLLSRILVAIVCIYKHEDQLRRTTLCVRTRFAKCQCKCGGILEHLL